MSKKAGSTETWLRQQAQRDAERQICPKRTPTNTPEIDRVLGGGLSPGITVVASLRGIGKTTAALQIAHGTGLVALVVSGEESRDALGHLCKRLGLHSARVHLLGHHGDVYAFVQEALALRAKVLVVDSLQTAYLDDVDADVGAQAQVQAVLAYLKSFAKAEKVCVLLIVHVRQDGEIASPSMIKKAAKTVLRIDSLDDTLRKFSVGKRETVLEMTPEGFRSYTLTPPAISPRPKPPLPEAPVAPRKPKPPLKSGAAVTVDDDKLS